MMLDDERQTELLSDILRELKLISRRQEEVISLMKQSRKEAEQMREVGKLGILGTVEQLGNIAGKDSFIMKQFQQLAAKDLEQSKLRFEDEEGEDEEV